MTPISVVIPSRNEGGNILRTVRSLVEGRSSGFPLEVVVVDDDSTDGSCDHLAGAVGSALNFRLVVLRLERWSGIPFARNRGAEAASCPVLLITDANTCYPRNWDGPVRQHFHPGRMLTGTIVDEATGARGYGLTLDLPSMGVGWLTTPPPFGGYVPVATCACTVIDRRLFHHLGGYDETLPLYGAAEPEFSVRAWLAGYEVVNVPDLMVGHRFRPPQDRSRFHQLNQQVLLRNYVRFACSYLPEDLLTRVLDFYAQALGGDFGPCIAELQRQGIWDRRAQLKQGLPYDFAWFASRFGLDGPTPAPPEPWLDRDLGRERAMTHPRDNQVEAVVINWRRPHNVAAIVSALRRQTIPCTITVCDCHDSPEFELPLDARAAIDRIYSWQHNSGAFSRYLPVGGYDHKYTFFIDDDMLPGARCVEHFLIWAERLGAFGALGQLGRILDSDGSYHPRDVARGPGCTEVDLLVRALFVRTDSLVHVPQLRNLLSEFGDPEDDILLSVGLAIYAGLACYLTPRDPDPETLVNIYELNSPYSRSTRPHHLAVRSRLLLNAMNLGWRPVCSRRQQPEPVAVRNAGVAAQDSGVLYLAIDDEYRRLTIASASSLRRYGYHGPIRVVTDMPDWLPSRLECESIVVPYVGDGHATRYYKTRLFEFAYESTLFLDSDAIPVGDINDIWGYLDDDEIAMAADLRPNVAKLIQQTRHHRSRAEYELMIRLGLTSRAFYNSGVMLFKRSAAVAALFTSWHQEWNRFRKLDQMALVRATALTGTRVRTLPISWNCPARHFTSIRAARAADVKILHFLSSDRTLLTDKLVSALHAADKYPPGGDWELWDLPG